MTNSPMDGFTVYLPFLQKPSKSFLLLMKVQVHTTNRTFLSSFLFPSFAPEFYLYLFLDHYFGQLGLQLSRSWACSSSWSILWSLLWTYVFLCAVWLWVIALHTHPFHFMCSAGTSFPLMLELGSASTIVIGSGWAHDWWWANQSFKETCAIKQASFSPEIVGTNDDISLKLLVAVFATRRKSLKNGVCTENAVSKMEWHRFLTP